MKSTLGVTALIFTLVIQKGTAQNTPTTDALLNDAANGVDNSFSVIERGANHRIWQRLEYETALDGTSHAHAHRYTELATGLHYKNAQGQWEESSEQIEILPQGGAGALKGQYQVYFPSDIYSDIIEMVTSDGKHLKSRPLGISYFDGTNSVLIAELTNSIGQILPSGNQVIYTNCFTDFAADLVLTYRKGSFESDLIFRDAPPLPEAFGLNAGATRLELLTEFFDTVEPAQSPQKTNPKDGLTDSTLQFGAMRMIQGKAFDVGTGIKRGSDHRIPVYKSWSHFPGNRTFLIEEIPFKNLRDSFEKLSASLNQKTRSDTITPKLKRATSDRVIPASRFAQAGNTNVIRQAKADLNDRSGVVLDYVAITASQTNFTFQGNTTYYVSGTVNLTGTTTIEGGTVVKFANNSSATLNVVDSLHCETGPYRTAIFTSRDDNSSGETISGSSGSPVVLSNVQYIYNISSLLLKFVRISYAGCGVYCFIDEQYGGGIWDCQFLNCTVAIQADDLTDAYLRNVLFSKCGTAVTCYVEPEDPEFLRGEHITADRIGTLLSTDYRGYFTNCIFTAVTNLALATLDHCITASDGNGIYQTAGGGNYYLISGNTNRNAGTTNINGNLLAEIKSKTTYPPIAYTNVSFNAVTTFSPQAQHDSDTPDLGYHYDPLDYAFGGCTAYTNLSFSAGTAVGWFRTASGWTHAGQAIRMVGPITISFDGTLEAPTRWARLNTVQEQDRTAGYGHASIDNWEQPYWPLIRGKFLRCYAVAGEVFDGYFSDDYGTVQGEMTDTEFWGGRLQTYGDPMSYTNCLMWRVNGVGVNNGIGSSWFIMRNCTLIGGTYSMNRDNSYGLGALPVSVRDCAFSGTTISAADTFGTNSSVTDYDYNAYTNTSNPFPIGGTHDKAGVTFNWQTGTLGDYYLPTDSVLINHGSQTADLVGLFHFTTQTNEVREGATQVDIGYHYVATSCNALDTVWVEDAVPSGATPYADGGDSWNWVSSGPASFSGAQASQSNIGAGEHQHYFLNASATMTVNSGDVLVTYVYLNPTNTPTEVMLQWNNGSWEHRAYWGANSIGWGTDGTVSRHYMGSMPATGKWVRLAIPASSVGLENQIVRGMAFTLYGGQAAWDYAGKSTGNYCFDTDGDGIPDYMEDSNGNGSVNSGETDWTSASDLGLKVWITRPKNNSLIP